MNINGLLIASNEHQFLKSFIDVNGKVTDYEAVKYTLKNSEDQRCVTSYT